MTTNRETWTPELAEIAASAALLAAMTDPTNRLLWHHLYDAITSEHLDGDVLDDLEERLSVSGQADPIARAAARHAVELAAHLVSA
jgi:hypothetical protein